MAKPTSKIVTYWHKSGIYQFRSRTAFRTLQLIFAVTVAGLYGVDIAYATKTNTHAHAEWIYAEFLAALSALNAILYLAFTMSECAWVVLDALLCILWVAQVGVFGTLYTSTVDPDYEHATLSVSRMRAAVWVDLINMLLWLITTVLSIVWCIRARKIARASKSDTRLLVGESLKGNYDEESQCDGVMKDVKRFIDQFDGNYVQGQMESSPALLRKGDSEKGETHS